MAATPVPILDASRLERQSLGDPRLKLELVALFVLELERLMVQFAAAADARQRGERLQAIAALARNVGATRLAVTARRAEANASLDADDQSLAEAVAETIAVVRLSGV